MEQFIKDMTATQACFVLMFYRFNYQNPISRIAERVAKRYNIDRRTPFSDNRFKENVILLEKARKVYYDAKRAKLKRASLIYKSLSSDIIIIETKARHHRKNKPTASFLLTRNFKFIRRETVYRHWFVNHYEFALEVNTNHNGTVLKDSWNFIGKGNRYLFSHMLPQSNLTKDNIDALINILTYK